MSSNLSNKKSDHTEMQQKMDNATQMTSDVLTNYLPFTLRRSYVERKVHITEMDEILQKDGLCILCGDGGSGKSTLAMHYALKQQRDSMESNERPFLVVRILQETTKTKLLQELQRMGRELKINDKIIEKEIKKDVQKYCRELTKLIYKHLVRIGQRLILILDNPQESSVLEDCNYYRYGLEKAVQVFVTTRNHHDYLDHKNAQITLSSFTYEEGQEYLGKRLKSLKQKNEERFNSSAYKLLKTVGCTPLRLNLAPGYLQENRFMTIDEYVDTHQSANPPEGVLPEVQMSLEVLDPMSQLVMHYSTKLETSYIPLDLFQRLLKVDEKELRKEIINPLERLSLVLVLFGRDYGSGYGIQIHEEVRASCGHYREWKGKAKMSERSLLHRIVPTVSKKMPYVDSVGDDNWQQAQLYAPQGTKVVEHAENVLGNDTSLANLFQSLGKYESLFCNFQQCLTYQKKALKMYQQMYGDKPHSDVDKSLHNIGLAYYNLDNIQEALEYYEMALKMRQEIHENKPHLDVAGTLNSIGAAHHNLGNIPKALEYHEKALQMYQQLYTTISPKNSSVYSGLDDFRKQLEHHKQSLIMNQQMHGNTTHSSVADSLNNIVSAYSELGDIQKSLEGSLKMQQQKYGDTLHSIDLKVAKTLYSIGLAYYNLDNIQKALEYHGQSLEMRQEIHGDKPHLDVASSLHNIGLAYFKLVDIQIALEYFEKALKMRQEIYGDTPHVDIIESLMYIGSGYEELGEKDIAKQYYHEGLAISQKLSDPYRSKKFVKLFQKLLTSEDQPSTSEDDFFDLGANALFDLNGT